MADHRCALVTGSTSGIGLGIAKALAAAGYDIMLNGFGEPDAIASLVSELRAQSARRIEHHGADLTDADQIESLVADTADALGRVDVLVNNAGMQHVSPVESFPKDTWGRIIDLNLSAAFYTIRATLPAMKAAGWGRIINIASVHGLVASVNKAAYVAAKHGIVGLTKVVALENAGTGVTCNAICPRFRAHATRRGADRGEGRRARHRGGCCGREAARGEAAVAPVRLRRADWRHGHVSLLARRGSDHRRLPRHRRRLDGAIDSAIEQSRRRR